MTSPRCRDSKSISGREPAPVKISVENFFTGPFSTALRRDELLTSISIPTSKATSGAYVKLSKRAGDFAVIAVATAVEWSRGGTCSDVRVALCSAGPVPTLVKGIEDTLSGSGLEEKAIENAATFAQNFTEPFEDPLVSSEYRHAMIYTMVKRALQLTRQRAGRNS